MVPAFLKKYIDDVSILVYGAPKVVTLAVDGDKYFIDVPIVTQPALTPFQCSPIARSKLEAPAPDRLVGDFNAALGKEILDITVAKTESIIEPDGIADDIRRETMTGVRRFTFVYDSSVPGSPST